MILKGPFDFIVDFRSVFYVNPKYKELEKRVGQIIDRYASYVLSTWYQVHSLPTLLLATPKSQLSTVSVLKSHTKDTVLMVRVPPFKKKSGNMK